MENKSKIYRMNEFDTVIARSKKEAVDWYWKEYFSSDSRDGIQDECEREKDLSKGYWFNLPENQFLDRIMKLGANETLTVSNWGGDPAFWITFKQILDDEELLNKFDIPGIICTTEY